MLSLIRDPGSLSYGNLGLTYGLAIVVVFVTPILGISPGTVPVAISLLLGLLGIDLVRVFIARSRHSNS